VSSTADMWFSLRVGAVRAVMRAGWVFGGYSGAW
jgi:hypothetical protein